MSRITLGPVPCQGCRRLVALVNREWHDAIPERQRTYFGRRWAHVHICPAMDLRKFRAAA